MSEKEKIDKIEKLTWTNVSKLLCALLDKQTCLDTSIDENLISCTSRGAFGVSSRWLFIYFPQKLSGLSDSEIEGMADYIKSLKIKHTPTNVFVLSNYNISKHYKESLTQKLKGNIVLEYWDRNVIIDFVNKNYPEYWRHDDSVLIGYEKEFVALADEDSTIKNLNLPQDKYGEMLRFFVEPKLTQYVEVRNTKNTVRKTLTIDDVVNFGKPILMEGPAGSGKSTILKQIGKRLIYGNEKREGKLGLPIYMSVEDIFNGRDNLKCAICQKIESIIGDGTLSDASEKYQIHLLLDSIDELENQEKIIDTIQNLSISYNIKFYLTTRNADAFLPRLGTEIEKVQIQRFDDSQIRNFLSSFFKGDVSKANGLMDALRSNKIIERLPITPLTLSLVSILYEETDFEIPATITDIYDKFNDLIIGRAIVSSKIEFIDASFKARLLSIYALKILEDPNHQPLTKIEYERFISTFLNGKVSPVKGTIDDVIDYMLVNTGVLYLKDGKYVQFTHASYMEYYAAMEIFYHQRVKESLLVENFFDANWQNASIFYAGKSKDMHDFLLKILEKIKTASTINEFLASILGCGYLLQALYVTDIEDRKNVIKEVLHLSMNVLDLLKKMSASEMLLYKDYTMPIINVINAIYFYESYNSITLKDPLREAFSDVYLSFKDTPTTALAYQLLEIAFTLNSGIINDESALNTMVSEDLVLKDPNLSQLTLLFLAFNDPDKNKEIKRTIEKKVMQLAPIHKELLSLPLSKLRFSALDTISPYKDVQLLTEGKTDASLLDTAFMVLTDGHRPYWNVSVAGHDKNAGSASEVEKTLTQAYGMKSVSSVIIGIFDHDAAGLSSFRKLKSDFMEVKRDMVKKHKDADIYAVCLPIPGDMDYYLREKQEQNYFEIEHYFGIDFLESKGMLKESGVVGIKEVIDTTGKKNQFAMDVSKLSDPAIFVRFLDLFRVIDDLAKAQVHYVL